MSHLAVPRTGWENEHLATYLLSQIAFVANPITVADDIGADFLCTLFEPRERDGTKRLYPLQSFAIQVKSSDAKVQATNKIKYLQTLALPFFLGIIHRSDLSLSVYSGEYLPIMFTRSGPPEQLTLCPVQARVENVDKAYECGGQVCRLQLPFTVKLSACDHEETRESNRRHLVALCTRMQANIAARVSKEYIYQLDGTDNVLIQAGLDSAQTFRHNFYLRLAEVFVNFVWLFDNRPEQFSREEFEVYATLYKKLTDMRQDLPRSLTISFAYLQQKMNAEGHRTAV